MKVAAIAQALTLSVLLICGEASSFGQEAPVHSIVGNWRINEELSEDTDEAVEAAIIKAGGKVSKNWFRKKEKERYRGGPKEQELYDRISYDNILRIDYTEPEFWFGYADGYQRIFHSDGRSRSVGASDHYANGGKDFAIAQWEGETLYVEGRPRDGGFTLESYTVEANGQRLRAELELKPANFGAAVKVIRIYDRQ